MDLANTVVHCEPSLNVQEQKRSKVPWQLIWDKRRVLGGSEIVIHGTNKIAMPSLVPVNSNPQDLVWTKWLKFRLNMILASSYANHLYRLISKVTLILENFVVTGDILSLKRHIIQEYEFSIFFYVPYNLRTKISLRNLKFLF